MPLFDFAATSSALLVVDVQERFLPVIPTIAADQPVGRACGILLAAARLLAIPTIISEQYPKGLGPTLPHLMVAHPEARRMAKTYFSCSEDAALQEAIDHLDASTSCSAVSRPTSAYSPPRPTSSPADSRW